MSRKNYFMRTTALMLSALLVASPAVIYAGEDVFFEDDTVVTEEVSTDYSVADVSFEEEAPLIIEEDASNEEQLFVADEDPSNTEGDSAIFEEPYISESGSVASEEPYISEGGSAIPEDSDITESEPVILEDLTVTEDPSLAPTLTVTYEPNGGTGSAIIDDNIEPGKTYTVKVNSFTYDNTTDTFLNWNTKPDGTGTDYNENYQFQPSESITLYAQWKPAKIGNTYYDTLTAALAAGSNKTVTLIKDVAVTNTENITNTVVVDLNGHTLRNAGTFPGGPILYETAGDLTVINSSDTDAAIYNDDGPGIISKTHLVLGRKTTPETNNFTVTGTASAIEQLGGTANINGGNYVAPNHGIAFEIADSTSTTIEAGAAFSGEYALRINAIAYGNVLIDSTLAPELTIEDGDSLVGIDAAEGYVRPLPLADALATASSVKLFKDVILKVPVESASTTLIDLNGFTISNGSHYLDKLFTISDGNLMIYDSKGNGSLVNTDPSGSAISFYNSSSATASLSIGSLSRKDFTISSNGTAISDESSTLTSEVFFLNGTVNSANKAGISGVDSLSIGEGIITAGTNGIEMTEGSLLVEDATIIPGSGKAIALGKDKSTPLSMTEVTIKGDIVPSLSIVASAVNGPIHVYNEGMFADSDVDVATGSLWVKGSLNEYYSLIAAGSYLTDQKDADTVYVAGDIENCSKITIKKKVTLDLNGRNVAGNDATALIDVNGGELTLVDSKGEGQISNTGTGSGVLVGASSKAVITLGSSEISSVDSAVSVNGTKATAIINSGEFNSAGISDISLNGGTLEVTGGQFNAANTIYVYNSPFDSVKVDNTVVDIEKCSVPTGCVWVTNGTTSTLKTAAKAFSEEDGTIVLTQNLVSPILVSKKITLDLNGKKVLDNSIEPYAIGIEKGGDLTIVNTGSAEGTIDSGNYYSIELLSSGKGTSPSLTVGDANSKTNNITIKQTVSTADEGIHSNVEGTITVNGGKITGSYTAIYNTVGDVNILDGVLSGGNAISHAEGSLSIKGGSVTGTGYALFIAPGDTKGADIEIRGGSFKGGTAAVFDVANAKINSFKVTGGSFDGKIDVATRTGFLMGGIYSESPNDILVAKSEGYALQNNTDPSTKALYPYMIVSTVDRYTLNISASPSDAASAPSSVPANVDPIAKATSVTVTAGSAVSGYRFIGWYEGDTVVSTEEIYTFTMEKDTDLTAVYAVPIVVKAGDDTVATGSDYVPDKTKITIVGIEGTGIIDTTNMTMTAATYNKNTSAVGSTHDIVVAGASIRKEYAKQYVISGYEKGTLTVVEGTGPEAFIEDVGKLPAEVTTGNLAAARAAVDAAKADYAQLSEASKNLDAVKTAKAKLDAVEAEVIKLEKDKEAADAVLAKIAALPSPDEATPADRTSINEAKEALGALTESQLALIPMTQKDKLNDVDKAVSEKEKAVAEQFTAAVNAVPNGKAGTQKGLLDKAVEIRKTLTPAELALVSDKTMSLYNDEVSAFKKDRTFKAGTDYYKVLSNGDVTYLKPASKTITSVTVPNQVKSGKFLFKVIKVSSNAFRNCDKLEWAVISENVYVLGQYVFARTTSLTTIKILGTGFKSGKVTDAFFKAGKNGKPTVKVPSSKVKAYSTLFKNEGKLKGTVKAK